MSENLMQDFILKRPSRRYAAIALLFLLIVVSTVSAETLDDAWKTALTVDQRLQASRRISKPAGRHSLQLKLNAFLLSESKVVTQFLTMRLLRPLTTPNFPLKSFLPLRTKVFPIRLRLFYLSLQAASSATT